MPHAAGQPGSISSGLGLDASYWIYLPWPAILAVGGRALALGVLLYPVRYALRAVLHHHHHHSDHLVTSHCDLWSVVCLCECAAAAPPRSPPCSIYLNVPSTCHRNLQHLHNLQLLRPSNLPLLLTAPVLLLLVLYPIAK
jgi:hypothetical protein